MSEPMVTYFADEYTLKRLAELEAENERLRKQWGYRNAEFLDALETSAAGATDLMNQWARQSYVEEAQDERDIHALARRLWETSMAEYTRLHEKIEQLELLEARSAREAKRERKRADLWRGECAKRARFLDEVQGHLSGYGFDDELSSLMQMPEESKP